MLKVFTAEYGNYGNIKSAQIINNALYILNDNERFNYGFLNSDVPENCISLNINSNKKIRLPVRRIDNCSSDNIIDGFVYEFYDSEISIRNIENTETLKIIYIPFVSRESNERICNILKINDIIYYINRYEVKINRKLITQKFIIRNLKNNNIFYTIILSSEEIKVVDDVIYLPFEYAYISTYSTFLVFYDHYSEIYI